MSNSLNSRAWTLKGMGEAYKWLGGIGYILALIPYANFIGFILVAIAWILMGRDKKQTIFTATGIFMILSGILLAVLLISFLPLMTFAAVPPTTPAQPFNLFAVLGAFLAIIIAVMVLALISFILEIIAHFRAAGVFGVKWFRYAGWMRVAGVVMIIIAMGILVAMIPTMMIPLAGDMAETPFNFFGMLMSILWPFILVGVIFLLADIFSIIAFFSIPSERETPPPPPPPPDTGQQPPT